MFAQSLYRTAQRSKEPKVTFFSGLQDTLDRFVSIDQKYYGELRPKDLPKEALRKLGEWL